MSLARAAIAAAAAALVAASGCSEAQTPDPIGKSGVRPKKEADMKDKNPPANALTATFGTGCFWCTEAVLQSLEGVASVRSGYMGGTLANPTYEQVCSGETGHAEVVQVTYDPDVISFEQLLEVFWAMHDPTTLNRQGNDVGTQYRSAIFYHDEAQRAAAQKAKSEADASGRFISPIVTEITAAGTFYPAEDDHQDYFNQNPSAGYCRYVILPKLHKLKLR